MSKAVEVIKNNLEEDLRRINQNINMYQSKIEKYPQGYLREKKINEKSYYYLRKRIGDKIQDKYVKKREVEETKALIKKRKYIGKQMNNLISQKIYIEKILRKRAEK